MHPDKAGTPLAMTLKLTAAAIILTFAVYVCWENTLHSPAIINWNLWAFSDWLINYEGGFVRRGLMGQLIRSLAHGGSAVTVINGLVFSIFATLCGLLFCLIVLSRPITPLMAVMLLLVPGGVYGMVMGNEFYYRKEIIFHVYFAAVTTLFLLARRKEGSKLSRPLDILTVVLIVTGSAILPFVHEGFLFISAVPTAVIIYWLACRRSVWTGRSVALAYLAVLAVQFLVFAVFKGNNATAMAIWASVHPDDQKLISSVGTMRAIGAIGWSLSDDLVSIGRTLTSGNAWNWVFIVVASAAYLVSTCFADWREGKEVHRRAAWVFTLYGICLAGSFPLFVLGWDWGRWIAAINLSVVILICAGEFRYELPVPVVAPFKPRAEYSGTLAFGILAVAILFGLSFKLPECCLGGSGQPFDHVWNLILGK